MPNQLFPALLPVPIPAPLTLPAPPKLFECARVEVVGILPELLELKWLNFRLLPDIEVPALLTVGMLLALDPRVGAPLMLVPIDPEI